MCDRCLNYLHRPLHAVPLQAPQSSVMVVLISLVFLAVFAGIALIAAEAVR